MAEVDDILTEVKVINSVVKKGDKSSLFAPSVDDLFTSHRDVWDFIKDYHNNYGDMPSFDVLEDRFDGEIEDVDVPGASKHYLDTLRSEYLDRRIESLLTRASKEYSEGTATAGEVKTRLQNSLAKLDRFSTTSRDLDVMDTEAAKRRYDEVRERAIAMGGTPGIPFGVEFIDACVPLGMQPGDVVSLIGYPARGKSALGTLVAANSIVRGYKPLIFSREMTAEAVQDRIYTVLASGLFSNTSLMLGDVNPDDFRTFAEKHDGKQGLSHIIDGNGIGDMTPNFIRGKIDQYRPDYVILDYMQLFMDNAMTEDMTGRMRNLSMEVKAAANYCQIPFLVISSATPPDGGKVDGPPNVERTAWSRQLSYDSTVSLAIHRQEDSNMYQIEGAKNRYGPLPSGFLEWDMDSGVYVEKLDFDE